MWVDEIAAAETALLGLRVAGLEFWLDARGSAVRLAPPPGHAQFLARETSEVAGQFAAGPASEVFGRLVLRVRSAPLLAGPGGERLLYRTVNRELWLDVAGRYVLTAPRQSPPRRAVIEPDFSSGEVFGEFAGNGTSHYPLLGLDNVILCNWLASYGDVILHASGVALGGKGYAFVGPAGVGKSTLAAHLAQRHGALVLGEDQVALRYLGGRFWIYGTPWHLNPAMCSPRGIPLESLFFLERTGSARVAPCASVDGVARLLQTAFVPYYNRAGVARILDRAALLVEQVPLGTLSYCLGDDVAGLILNTR